MYLPCRVGLVVSVSASHTVGRGFASWPGHTTDHHQNGTNCQPALYTGVRVGVSHPDCLKGQVVCCSVYGYMHLSYLLGSIARVGYCTPVPDFYLVLHGLRSRKGTFHFSDYKSVNKRLHMGISSASRRG